MYERNYHDSVLSEEKAQSVKKKKKRVFSWKNALLTALCIIVVGGFITATQLNRLQVREVVVEGANSADPKDVSVFVTESLSGKWLYLFPKTSIVLLPDHYLEKAIKRAFPKFSDVSVVRRGTQTVKVSVREYEGVYVWCEAGTENCSFMSYDGVVFAPAPFFSGSAYIKLFVESASEYPFVPITTEQLTTMRFLVERLQGIAIEPSEFHFFSGPERTEVVFYHNGYPARLIVDPNIPADTSLQSFFTAIRTAPFSIRYRDGFSILEYIDVRLPNKIVYKFQ